MTARDPPARDGGCSSSALPCSCAGGCSTGAEVRIRPRAVRVGGGKKLSNRRDGFE